MNFRDDFVTFPEDLKFDPKDMDSLEILYRSAIFLAQMGNLNDALEILEIGSQKFTFDAKTIALIGRLYKDFAFMSENSESFKCNIKEAEHYYKLASQFDSLNAFPVINAAFCAAMLDNKEKAREYSNRVVELIGDNPIGYYDIASKAEAFAILGEIKKAQLLYKQCRVMGKGRYRDLIRTKRQADLIAKKFLLIDTAFESCFGEINVLLNFHIDPLGFNQSIQEKWENVEDNFILKIRERLIAYSPEIVICAISTNSSLLFCEEIITHSIELHVVLPCQTRIFLEGFKNYRWLTRVQSILTSAKSIHAVSEQELPKTEIAIQYLHEISFGKAKLISQYLAARCSGIVFLSNCKAEDKLKDDVFNQFQSAGIELHDLDLIELGTMDNNAEIQFEVPQKSQGEEKAISNCFQIKSILFADVVGYSMLQEREIRPFVEIFMKQLAETIEEIERKPKQRNSWGDAIFLVYNNPVDAGMFALKVVSKIKKTSWQEYGLPQGLSIRIGLHAGPVTEMRDPILERENFFGHHVNWAARIEPQTRPGSIFASEEFVCLAALDNNCPFNYVLLGEMPLAKGFGNRRIYEITAKQTDLRTYSFRLPELEKGM